MSSSTAGTLSAGAGAAAAVPKPFFCHQYNRIVTISVTPASDPLCPRCNEGFLEESENPNPNPNSLPESFSPFKDIFSLLPFPFSFSAYGAPSIYSALAPSMASILLRETPPSSAPLISSATTSRLCNPTAPTSSFVIEDQPYGLGGGGFRLPVNVGDYFEQLIQQLAENDPNRYETPPASKSAIDAL